jgi:ATP-binding cassette subfamily B protein
MRRTATLIVIAHKLNTIRSADQIVVLDPDGSVCQTGNHEELYGRPGRYRDYCLAREEAENWRLA